MCAGPFPTNWGQQSAASGRLGGYFQRRVEVPGVCGPPSILCPSPQGHREPAELNKPRAHRWLEGTAQVRECLALVAEWTEPGLTRELGLVKGDLCQGHWRGQGGQAASQQEEGHRLRQDSVPLPGSVAVLWSPGWANETLIVVVLRRLAGALLHPHLCFERKEDRRSGTVGVVGRAWT